MTVVSKMLKGATTYNLYERKVRVFICPHHKCVWVQI